MPRKGRHLAIGKEHYMVVVDRGGGWKGQLAGRAERECHITYSRHGPNHSYASEIKQPNIMKCSLIDN